MGFEEYSVLLTPKPDSRFAERDDPTLLQEVARALKSCWSAIHDDEQAIEWLPYPKHADEIYLCYETEAELFQIRLAQNVSIAPGTSHITMRLAYCNPRSSYEPFCEVIQWLMRQYDLICVPMRDLGPPESRGTMEVTDDLADSARVRAVLVPSLDYNRRLWHLDAGTTEEAPLRPEEAIERFILPLCEPLNAQDAGSKPDVTATDEPSVGAAGSSGA